MPVATEDVYRGLWVPKATQLQADFVLRFGLGIEIGAEDLSQVLSELKLLNTEFQKDTQAEERTHVAQRIERLMDELGRVFTENPKAKMYIG